MTRTVRMIATLALCMAPGFATAQSSSPPVSAAEDLTTAQQLVNRASQAFSRKDYKTALDALQRAEALAAAANDPALPAIRFNIARCFEELNRFEEAIAAYGRYNELPDQSHRKQRAWEAMQRLKSKVYAQLSVVCSPAGSLIEIAGLTKGAVTCPWKSDEVPPGAYAVKISHPGYESQIQTVDVSSVGKGFNVEVTLKSLLPPPSVAGMAPSKPVNPWPWMTMGAGLVVAATGGFFTSSAVDNRSEVQDLPPGSERTSLQDDFEFNRTLSYAMYGTGGALVAGGLLWWILDEFGGDDDAADEAAFDFRPSPSGIEVRF